MTGVSETEIRGEREIVEKNEPKYKGVFFYERRLEKRETVNMGEREKDKKILNIIRRGRERKKYQIEWV